MQTASYGSEARSSYAAAKIVLASEGLRGFYRGFGITVMREVRAACHSVVPMRLTTYNPQIPFTSLQFPLYEMLKAQVGRQFGRKPLAHEAAICGSISGGIAAAATTPLDVLKTRVMLDLRVRVVTK